MNDLTSSEEPTSSDEPVINYKIMWKLNTNWYSWTNQLGYPRPQGNIPMMLKLTGNKQQLLMRAYDNVHGQ
jgi:hypothetical protein